MKRILIMASHHNMAEGLRETLEFVTGDCIETVALAAYVDNSPVEEQIQVLMDRFSKEDEVVVLTDMTYGSVNQQFFKYRSRPHTHIVSGMNLPLAVLVAMEAKEDYISTERMRQMVETAKQEIKYVNDIVEDGDDEDE